MNELSKRAIQLHENVPPDWYIRSIKENIFQWYWHKRRFEEVSKSIDVTGGYILDIGSADGLFTKAILDRSRAEKVIGIDVLKSSVEWANKHWARNKRLRFQIGDAHKLDFRADTFDAVSCLEVLEHVLDPLSVLREIGRVLKRGGYTIILVPSENLLFKIVWWLWQKWRGKIWKDTHLHNFSNGFLENLLEQSGLQIEENRKFLLGMLHLVKARKIR